MNSTNVMTEDRLSDPDLIWGAAEIGKVLGLRPRQAFHLINNGNLRSVRKIGGRLYASRQELIREVLTHGETTDASG